ncbi:peptidylprolyl isomerase [Cohnella panacarvi]|uniref:peptidylprolyl isomerase n=1 Tax=Cohnella panacarvi TaxID=400776 RepID=UPI0004B5F83D|nr:peptidylprolyl isomerase [Cohnella panacarvi]
MSLDQVVALQIDGRSYSLAAVLRSAAIRGSFGAINDYVSDALIASFAEDNGISVGQEEIQEAVNDWRVANGLYQASELANWLTERGLSMSDVAEFARMKALEERVRHHVAAGKVDRYFTEHRSRFEAVALSQIVVNERGLARELRFKTMEGEPFYMLARAYSIDESSRLAGGFIGRKERPQLPKAIEAQAFGAVSGTIAGPLEIDKKFYVIKVEEVYPAELNGDIRARIERIFFDEWLAARRMEANVRKPALWT